MCGRVSLLVLLGGACGKELNPEYCLHNPQDGDCRDAGLVFIDAAPPCTADPQCQVEGKGVCDPNLGVCVQCTPTDHLACTGVTGSCNENDVCVGCTTGSQCTSGVCLTDSYTCAALGHVLYVAVGAPATNTCRTPQMPCTLANALVVARMDAAMPGYPGDVIEMAGGDYREGPLTLDVPMLVITAQGTGVTITSATSGPIFNVTKGPVELDGVTLHDANNADALSCTTTAELTLSRVSLVDNPQDGVHATNGCQVTIDRCTFARNNDSSMYFDDATINVRNSFVFDNGNGNLTQGGISLNGTTHGELRFNSIAFNTAKKKQDEEGQDYVAGLRCAQQQLVNASDNLFADNSPLQATYTVQNCGNLPVENWFGSSTTVHFASSNGPGYDLHLTASTPNSGTTRIRDNGNTNCANVTHDFDNDTRPVGGACDYGADELK